MTYGLQLFNAAGTLVFDSGQAVGGVCLGFFNVPNTGATFTFPAYVGRTGVAIAANSGSLDYTADNAPGYLRFTFPAQPGNTVALFVK